MKAKVFLNVFILQIFQMFRFVCLFASSGSAVFAFSNLGIQVGKSDTGYNNKCWRVMTCICWVAWNGSGQLMLCCRIALAVLMARAQEQLQHRSHNVSAAVSNQERSATHKRAQQGCSPWACSSQCLRDCVVHARFNNCCNPRVVSTSTDPMEEVHGIIKSGHYKKCFL